MFSVIDHQMMQRAILLAQKGRFTTAPNPNVGCVICLNDHLVGEGFHYRAGQAHAEINALKMAQKQSQGATAYVTLEPCSHFGKTPPCADALIKAGIKRVVCAMVDPNPNVAGQGIARLRDAGIKVDLGLMQAQAKALNLGFIKMMETNLPYVQLKLASSLDGRTALANGKSQWITGAKARQDVQLFRAQSGALLSTSQTVLDDDPSLNVRWAQLPDEIKEYYQSDSVRQPIRVILDAKGKLSPQAKIFSLAGDIIIFTNRHDWSFKSSHLNTHIEFICVSQTSSGLNLNEVMQELAKRGINQIWVEAGATLAGSLLSADLVDELIIYQAPMLLGSDGRPLVKMKGLTGMDQSIRFELTDVTQIGRDIRLRMLKKSNDTHHA